MEREHLYGTQVTMRPDTRRTILVLIVGASLSCNARCQSSTVFSVAPEPVGSGARALGQSAFIAVADDATAASWNPAGLINLEKPEASFVGLWRTMRDELSSTTAGTSLEGDTWSEWEINFMSYAQPIVIGRSDAVLSVNYHQVYDLGLEYSLAATVEEGQPPSYEDRTTSVGAISAYSLAGGWSLPPYPQITVGGSFNWYVQSLHHGYVRESEKTTWTKPPFSSTRFREEINEVLDDLRGYNFTLGILWDAWEREGRLLTLGMVYHTPFSARLDQEVLYVNADGSRDPPDRDRIEIDFPSSLGAGANYRFSDSLSTAFDIQWTDWSGFGYTNAPATPSSDALAIRLGFERLWFPPGFRDSVWAMRGGAFYDPRPAWSDILSVYGISLGLGWTTKERFSLDFAYQYRWGEGDNFTADGRSDFDYEVEEHWLIGSVIVYFR